MHFHLLFVAEQRRVAELRPLDVVEKCSEPLRDFQMDRSRRQVAEVAIALERFFEGPLESPKTSGTVATGGGELCVERRPKLPKRSLQGLGEVGGPHRQAREKNAESNESSLHENLASREPKTRSGARRQRRELPTLPLTDPGRKGAAEPALP
jgi:hypothetical protein